MGTFSMGAASTSLHGTTLDPRLISILQQAASFSTYNIVGESGVRPYNPKERTINHPNGWAMDVQLVDENGKVLNNYQNGASFAAYEQFAQIARAIQQRRIPSPLLGSRWE